MYKVMVIDDEAYFREYLRTTIPWQDYGFEICGEACNGEEGLKKVSLYNPDIILADINMPIVDGLDFSKIIKEKFPYICIILITGYNEFEYAKKAIRIGIANYISKPFKKEELIESMLSLKKTITSQRRKDIYINRLEKQNCEKFPLLRRNLLYNTVKGMYENKGELLQKELKSLKITLPNPPFIIAIMEIENFKVVCPNVSGRETVKNNMMTIIDSVLHKEVKYICFDGEEDQIVLIAGMDENRDHTRNIRQINSILCGIHKNANVAATVGVGVVCEDLADIRASYEKADFALRNKFLLRSSKVIEFNSLRIEDTSKEVFPIDLKNDLFMYLRFADADKINDTLDKIHDFLKIRRLYIDYIYILYSELLSMCFSALSERGYKNEDVFSEDFYPFQDIVSRRTMEEVHDYVRSIYNKMLLYLMSNKKTNSSKVIKKAKEYIDGNYYRSELVIEEIASNVFFHPSYLRFLFKKETGMTVGDYLAQVRMAKAKELLKNGGLKYTEVANTVGYSDAAYFSKCFKKYYNVCPSEYEKSVSHIL